MQPYVGLHSHTQTARKWNLSCTKICTSSHLLSVRAHIDHPNMHISQLHNIEAHIVLVTPALQAHKSTIAHFISKP
jgi:hypothetical protein